jgi:four helix bundle protein
MKESVILHKTFQFAVLIVKVCQRLAVEKKEHVLSKQLLRSGTSIGANVEESEGAISKKKFISKLQIAYKEAKEARYWLKLLYATKFIEKSDFEQIFSETDEILKIIVSILKSAKTKNNSSIY